MASQNFVGKGPSREILDLRESRNAMERIKQQFMSQEDLDDLFEYLGIKVSTKNALPRKRKGKHGVKRPFAISDIDEVEQALKRFKPDPKAPYAYKTPQVKDPNTSKKPGRPKGTKKKRPNKNESLTSETSIEMSDIEMSDSDLSHDSFVEEAAVDSKQTGRKLSQRNLKQSGSQGSHDSSSVDEAAVGSKQTGRILRKRKTLTQSDSQGSHDDSSGDEAAVDSKHTGKMLQNRKKLKQYASQGSFSLSKRNCNENEQRVHSSDEFNATKDNLEKEYFIDDSNDLPKTEENRNNEKRSNEQEEYNENKSAKDKSNFNYQCSFCNEQCKKIDGVRAHYIVDHAWEKFKNSPVMTDNLENLYNIFSVDDKTGRFKCTCDEVCPAKIMNNENNEEENDCWGRRWVLVHRLVDSRHYQPSKTHRLTEIFPNNLIIFKGLPWKETNTEDAEPIEMTEDPESDLSLPDIDKYSREPGPEGTDGNIGNICINEEIEEFSDEENNSDKDYSPNSDVDNSAKISSKDKNKYSNSMAKKDRKRDTKAFTNLKKRARDEAQNYTLRLKCEKNNLFTFEILKTRNTEPYSVTFGERDVTCNCKSFRDIEERKYTSANEVCKHVALITLYCHENLRSNFNGQRWFSTRSAFGRVSEMLKSFDPSRDIFERPKHANFSLYPPPIPNPIRKFPYFKKKEYAIFQLKKLLTPKWIAEKYNRYTNQGDKPACKACNRKIALGNLCLRVDYTSLFINRNFKSDEFSLRISPFRICTKISCFKDLNSKLVLQKKYREESNLPTIYTIELENIFDNDKTVVENLFQNENVVVRY